MQRRRLRPLFTTRELSFLVLALACLAGAVPVSFEAHVDTAAVIVIAVLCLCACVFASVFLGPVVRRSRAQPRGSAE
jgi:hypothetical protein